MVAQTQAQQARANSMFSSALSTGDQAKVYQKRINEMRQMQNAFNVVNSMSGQYAVSSIAAASATEKYTSALSRNRVGWGQWIAQSKLAKKAYAEQLALQNASTVSWGRNSQGKILSSVLVPDKALKSWDSLASRVGYFGRQLESASRVGGEWARGMQRTGFQITQGIGLPLAALGAVAGVVAYKVDQELTGIAKVYDSTVSSTLQGQDKMIAQAREIESLKNTSLENAKNLAAQYGASVTDTLGVQKELAATGQNGDELIKATNEVQRAAILGELDRQDAIKATISLQSTYNMSSRELADTFNFMNKIENETSLTMQDMVVGFPKVLPIISSLGGSVKDAAILMTAMRAGGVDATEGANALKSGLGGLIRPTQVTTKALAEMGVQIDDIPRAAGGDMIKMLIILQERIKNLDAVGQQNAFYRLFGKEQASRMQILSQQLGNVGDSTSQVARAMAAAGVSTEELSATANAELKKIEDSISNRLKRAAAVIQGELASIGETVLHAVAPIAEGLGTLLKFVDNLPAIVKWLGLIGIGATVAFGVIFLLVGAFANLANSITGAIGGLLQFRNKFKLLNAEEVAARAEAVRTSGALDAQTGALNRATTAAQTYASAMGRAVMAQAGILPPRPAQTYGNTVMGGQSFINGAQFAGYASNATASTARMVNGQAQYYHQGAWYRSAGAQTGRGGRTTGSRYERIDTQTGQVSRASEANYAAAAAAAKATDQAAKNTQRMAVQANVARVSFTGIASAAAGLAFLPMTIQTLTDETASFSQKFMMVALTAASLLPLLGGVLTRMKQIAAVGLAQGFRAAGMALVGMLGPIGILIAAGAAIGGAWYVISKQMGEAKKQAEALSESGNAWADVIGFTATEKSIIDTTNETLGEQTDLVAKLRKEHEDLYKSLQNIEGLEQKVAAARVEGLKAFQSGANEDQVRQTIRTALGAMNVTGEQQDEIVSKISVQLMINDPEQVRKQFVLEAGDLIRESVEEVNRQSWWATIFRPDGLSESATAAGVQAGGAFYEGLSSIEGSDREGQKEFFDNFIQTFNRSTRDAFDKIKSEGNNASIFDILGIENMEDLNEQVDLANTLKKASQGASGASVRSSEEYKRAMEGGNEVVEARKDLLNDLTTSYDQTAAQEKLVAQEIARRLNFSEDEIESVSRIIDVQEKLGLVNIDTAKTANSVADSYQYFADSVGNTTGNLEENSEELDEIKKKMSDVLKTSMSGTMDSVYESFDTAREGQQDAALDRIQAAGEARLDKLDAQEEAREAEFDARQESADQDFKNRQKAMQAMQETESKDFQNRWEVIMDDHEKKYDDLKTAAEEAADAQIQAIDDQIAKEEEQEAIRERIFEAQQARIQRMAEMFNNNIDFNAALNSGNLDEAARIQNSAAATTIGWAQDDTDALLGDASEKKKEALNAEKDVIEQQKDDRLAAIDEMEKAEQKQLEDRKDREKEELEARQEALQERLQNEQEAWNKSLQQERKRYQDSISAQRDALQKQNTAQETSAKARFDSENRSLEQQLAALKAYTPRNQQELNDHIAKVQALYEQFGTSYLKPTSQTWGQFFGNEMEAAQNAAAAALQNDINWADIASQITNEMARAIDLTGDSLVNWLKNPTMSPWQGSVNVATAGYAGGSRMSNGFSGGVARHSGGSVGWSSADRVGVPRTASLYPSETPAILKRGEFVMNTRATRAFGPQLAQMNANPIVRHSGGPVGGFGGALTSAIVGAAFGKALAQGIAGAIMQTVMASSGAYGVGAPGKYGNINLDSEQLGNASLIMSVGKRMGASQRDLIIAIATAMQESTLRNINYGDRDSVGLFQQRPSQGWGTVAQIMDPNYSATKFFEALLKVKNRDQMSVTQAAQKVQRSGFPNAYAQWEKMATAVVQGTPMMLGAAFQQGQAANAGGMGLTIGKNGYTYPAMQALMSTSGVPFQVTSTKRNKNDNSKHNIGQAIDFDDFASPKVDTPGLYAIWKWIYDNFGSKSSELIYAGPGAVSLRNGRPHNYNAKTMAAHHNHVHWAMTPQAMASIGIPQLAVGGNIKYDNVLANLHKGETVLTAPLSRQLHDNINNVGRGETIIHINNPVVREEPDIARIANAVKGVMNERDRRNGRGRIVKNG